MFPLSWRVGLRYIRSRQKNHFISFISMSAMLGIALGVAVLITVLSVMNGFDEEIQHRFFGMAPEMTVTGVEKGILNWDVVRQKIATIIPTKTIAPFVGSQGLLTYEGQISPIIVMGILSDTEEAVTHLKEKMILGHVAPWEHFGAVIGESLAQNLGVTLGDAITLMIPEASVTPAGMIPRFKRFRVQGIFSAGTGFGFEQKMVFISLEDAQKLLKMPGEVSGFRIKIEHPYDAPLQSQQLAMALGEMYQVGNWTQDYGAFFQAVKMEKSMMFLILTLIIAVAAFNLVSSLVMTVNDKRSEIAILRTLGATPKFIVRVFMIQGMMVGALGTCFGLLGGLLLATYATQIVDHLQTWFGLNLWSSHLYWVDYLPCKILVRDLIHICGVALSMSFVATLYPAFRASKTVIAEALYDE